MLSPSPAHIPTPDAQELSRLRALLLLGNLLYPAWGLLFLLFAADANDSVWERIAIAAPGTLVLLGSYASPWVRRHLSVFFHSLAYVMTTHYFLLVHRNGLDLGYSIGAFVVVLAVSYALVSRRALITYSAFVLFAAFACALDTSPGPTRFVLPLGLATVLIVCYTALDVRLRILEALRESEGSFRDLFNATFEGILVHDGNRILDVNEACAHMFGYRREELIGMGAYEPLDPVSRELAREKAARRWESGGPTKPYELVGVRKDGTRFALEVAGKLHQYRGRRVNLIAARDVSERKEMEARLRLADRLASIGTLAAGVGHEINNPLFVVMGNLDIALETLKSETGEGAADPWRNELRGVLETAQRGAERVRIIVRELKFLSRQDEASLGPVDIHHVIDSSASMTNNEVRHRAKLVKRYGVVPRVHGNEARLVQVVVNLLVNAAQAIDEGDSDRNEIAVATRQEGKRVVVEVTDTGKGMTPDVVNRMFDPFFTTKPVGVGTGLGLSICHKIVTELGGEITVESVPGKGSAFRVLLPVAEGTPEALTLPPAGTSTPEQKRRILVVEDEPAICRLLQQMLGLDHDVVTALSGREALGLYRKRRNFDIVLCDIMMPEMTGMDVFDAIRREFPGDERRLIFMTGGAFTTLSRDFLKSVPNPCIEKPIEFRKLRELIARVGETPRGGKAAA